MAKASRTVNPLHFEDLGGHRFEDLVRQVLHSFRKWDALEATGRSGSDDGIDIRGIEPARYLEGPDQEHSQERLWIIQCKNYKDMGPAEVREIVANDLGKQPEPPYGYMLVAACTFSKKAYDAFHAEVARFGVQQALIWGKGELEDQLFTQKNAHLLKAYFDISLHEQAVEKTGPTLTGPPLAVPPRADHFSGQPRVQIATPEGNSQIYISYAWGGESEALVNQLDENFQKRHVTIIRDKRDLGYKDSIRTFMAEIGSGKCVILIISDQYLKSKNCWYELLHIASHGEFSDRVFPIVLPDANIYDPITRLEYVKYWENQIERLESAMREVSLANQQGFREELDLDMEIRARLPLLVDILQDMNSLTPDMHSSSDFAALFDAIMSKLAQ